MDTTPPKNQTFSPEFQNYLKALNSYKAYKTALMPKEASFEATGSLTPPLGRAGSISPLIVAGTGLTGNAAMLSLLTTGLQPVSDDRSGADLYHLLPSAENLTLDGLFDRVSFSSTASHSPAESTSIAASLSQRSPVSHHPRAETVSTTPLGTPPLALSPLLSHEAPVEAEKAITASFSSVGPVIVPRVAENIPATEHLTPSLPLSRRFLENTRAAASLSQARLITIAANREKAVVSFKRHKILSENTAPETKQAPILQKASIQKQERALSEQGKSPDNKPFDYVQFRRDFRLLTGRSPNSVVRNHDTPLLGPSVSLLSHQERPVETPIQVPENPAQKPFEFFPVSDHYVDDTDYVHSVTLRGSKLTSGDDEAHQKYLAHFQTWKFAHDVKTRFGNSLASVLAYQNLDKLRPRLPTQHRNGTNKKTHIDAPFRTIKFTKNYKNFFSNVPVECDTVDPHVTLRPAGYLPLLEGKAKIPLGQGGYVNFERLLLAKGMVESSGRPLVDKGQAQGLMQIKPDAAHDVGLVDRHDPVQSMEGGRVYIRYLMQGVDGDIKNAETAYNLGLEGSKHPEKASPMRLNEAKNYFKKVEDAYNNGPIPYVYGDSDDMRDELMRACMP